MQSLQLHRTGAAWSWLSKLPKDSIKSWNELAKQFTCNFRSTYKRLASIKEIKADLQRSGESLRSYIQCWSIIKNSAKDVSDKQAIDAFIVGLRHSDFIEEMGRIKPKTVSELMDVANNFADGEDTYHNKSTRSPKMVGPTSTAVRGIDSRNYDNYSSYIQVATKALDLP
jgi:hypothetical protein